MAEKSTTGLTEAESKEFHELFMASMTLWFGLVVLAHVLSWMYRPWL
ncbi:light-harvesting antenna LH1, beta subunit [Thiorhodovibrio frisius]|uniref:Antenna complex alpha/beta subunit n=1 Tax=Thiorhodovibrio frisius TaxID=631362 RepID=H8Z3R8_9GAMM|nr:light-harvesting antenna LH1, beta subunit [Thiorhodovibrio frisius]EIC20057.1 Antenna complex alpha/beta subunit [Thiorhodovibrio frisius]WPL20786.1 light-harvesting protein, PufB [Thiorhodovibrio frisius]